MYDVADERFVIRGRLGEPIWCFGIEDTESGRTIATAPTREYAEKFCKLFNDNEEQI